MSRYEAKPYRNTHQWWEVVGTAVMGSSGPFTITEAHIIAFALNAVAEGKYLAASPGYTLIAAGVRNSFEPGDYTEYHGPTEGVAPHG